MKARCSCGYYSTRSISFPHHRSNEYEQFTGICWFDYHDNTLQVCILDTDGTQLANDDCANDWQAIARFAGRFERPVRAAIESCCGAAKLAEELVNRAGRSVDLAHKAPTAQKVLL